MRKPERGRRSVGHVPPFAALKRLGLQAMWWRIAKYILGVTLALSTACHSAGHERARCVASTQPALTNAGPEPPIPLSRAQIAAIGAIEVPGGGLRCTGTLIADRWVITAKHCVLSDDEALVFRTSVGSTQIRVPLLGAVPHPSFDIVLFEIAPSDAVASGELQPLELWAEETVAIGDWLTLSGYGVTETGTQGTLLFLDETVVEVEAMTIHVDGGDQHGACYKDSGGPLLGIDEQGVVRLVGTLIGGGANCVGRDEYVRLKAIFDWAEQVKSTRADDPCAGLSWEGACKQRRAIWCEKDQVAATDCQGKQVCGWDGDESGFRCVDDEADPCRGIGTSGACESGTLLTCDRGQIVETDCGACGKRCAWDAEFATCE